MIWFSFVRSHNSRQSWGWGFIFEPTLRQISLRARSLEWTHSQLGHGRLPMWSRLIPQWNGPQWKYHTVFWYANIVFDLLYSILTYTHTHPLLQHITGSARVPLGMFPYTRPSKKKNCRINRFDKRTSGNFNFLFNQLMQSDLEYDVSLLQD